MGDPSTHAVLFEAYWHLCVEELGDWVDVKNQYQRVCKVGDEERAVPLKSGRK